MVNLEKYKICCNPFGSHGDKKADKFMYFTSDVYLKMLKDLNITWVTDKMCICAACKVEARTRTSEPQEKRPRADSPASENNQQSDEEYVPEHFEEQHPEEVSYISVPIKELNDFFIKCDNKIEFLKIFINRHTDSEILTLIPDSTLYMVKQAKNKSVQENPKHAGRPSIVNEVESNIKAFYLSDNVSRPFPGMKDVLSVKENGKREKKTKRLLLDTIENLYEKYLTTPEGSAPEWKVSLSTFKKHRPKYCVFTSVNKYSGRNVPQTFEL